MSKKTNPSYRGLLNQGDQVRIPLSGGDTDTGYRIVKLVLMPNDIDASTSHECSVQVFSQKQATIHADIDFSKDELLAAGYYARSLQTGAPYVIDAATEAVIFDNTVVNQDIFVGYQTGQSNQKINYYLELEEVKMSGPEQAVINYKAALLHGE